MMEQVAVPKSSQEHVWQFPVADDEMHLADNGARYFEFHAKQLANSLSLRVLAFKDVKLERTTRNVWVATGTVVVQN